MPVLLLALNEVNFDAVRAYVGMGKLPALGRLIAEHGVTETTSERKYEELEPWIQWVTAHTGLTLAQHGVFRLGDIVQKDIPQIWEVLEAEGLKVGAVSPMNAKNRCRDAAFFVPDPWTETAVTGTPLMRKFYTAVAQSVNENASARMTLSSAFWLALGLAVYARPRNYGRYLSLMLGALRGRSWARALVLDLVLADLFVAEARGRRVDFGSLFLNAAAHIQHHYMFNSKAYNGPQTNPEWYIPSRYDPVLEVYEVYDAIIAQIRQRFPDARLMLATGLHQDPHPETTFYWRLRDHSAFLDQIGLSPTRIQPLMSRDFLVEFADEAAAAMAERRLASVRGEDGAPLFETDNRGRDLFVMLVWPKDIPQDFTYFIDGQAYRGLRDQVAFVAIKNGRHNGIGYLLDTAATAEARPMPLTELPARIAAACGVIWPAAGKNAMGAAA
ncbi:hypothetical protein [Phenylobacterium sp.]|uniref:hypothetical protein n=1 Tax=Phenylobacterium sp. TaxID=1871053 RepID=UPI0028112071|nr:hypothetical protein [Phenylobacterium sp.]